MFRNETRVPHSKVDNRKDTQMPQAIFYSIGYSVLVSHPSPSTAPSLPYRVSVLSCEELSTNHSILKWTSCLRDKIDKITDDLINCAHLVLHDACTHPVLQALLAHKQLSLHTTLHHTRQSVFALRECHSKEHK